MAECPLCQAEKLTEWKHEDDIVWVARCKSHPDKWMIVLKAHKEKPSFDEVLHVMNIQRKLFPTKEFRGPQSILDHYHLHEI